ncbi:MAG TPA: carbohydrate ABC transporter permease, partial [Desulfobacterales bacterium]|nr:carbohydrate ABC transporter permease [Desulfobacterales bacterium]
MSARRKVPWTLRLFEVLMIVLALAWIYPAVFVLTNALKTEAEITLHPVSLPRQPTLANFAKAWTAMEFPRVFANTLLITVLGVGGILLVSSMAAYMLARTLGRLSWLLYLVFAFALVIPFQIVMVPIVVLATDLNLSSIPGIIPMYWGLGVPMAVFLYHGFVKGVPRELEEAAGIDGAGRFFTFFRIVFPLLQPITATVAIIDALWIWNDFLLPLIILSDNKKYTLLLSTNTLFGQYSSDWSAILSALVIAALPVILF